MESEEVGVEVAGGSRPRQKAGLDISPADDGFIIYEPERDKVHYLNATAVLILEFCDGRNTAAEIAELVRAAYGLSVPPFSETCDAITTMASEELLAL